VAVQPVAAGALGKTAQDSKTDKTPIFYKFSWRFFRSQRFSPFWHPSEYTLPIMQPLGSPTPYAGRVFIFAVLSVLCVLCVKLEQIREKRDNMF